MSPMSVFQGLRFLPILMLVGALLTSEAHPQFLKKKTPNGQDAPKSSAIFSSCTKGALAAAKRLGLDNAKSATDRVCQALSKPKPSSQERQLLLKHWQGRNLSPWIHVAFESSHADGKHASCLAGAMLVLMAKWRSVKREGGQVAVWAHEACHGPLKKGDRFTKLSFDAQKRLREIADVRRMGQGLQNDGKRWRLNPKGMLIEEISFVRGEMSGPYLAFHPDGKTPKAQGSYKADRQHGKWERRHADGTLAFKGTYDIGMPVGRVESFYPGGQKQEITTYKDGEKHGAYAYHGKDGKKLFDAKYTRGEMRHCAAFPQDGPKMTGKDSRDCRFFLEKIEDAKGKGQLRSSDLK